MNKFILWSLIFVLGLVTLSGFSHAYSNSTLINYFTFGDGNGTKAYDTVTGKNLTAPYTFTSVTGKQGNALYRSSNGANYVPLYNTNLFNFGDNSFTVNYWSYSTGVSGYLQMVTGYANDGMDYQLGTSTNTSGLRSVGIAIGSYGVSTVQTNTTVQVPNYNWYMVTLVYNLTTNRGYLYVNGNLSGYVSQWNIPSSRTYFMLRFWENGIDELSLWNTDLNSSDIKILYNNNAGLNYAETLKSGNGFVDTNYSENQSVNYTFSGIYHNYCWYYINCNDYNVSEDICMDEVYKVCSDTTHGGCADTFDTYKGVGLENVTPSFSAQCYNDQFYYQYPSYEGLNGSVIYDVCFGSYLCHTYNLSSSDPCPFYYNGNPNKLDCKIINNSIVATCYDTVSLYDQLGTYPPNNNYSAYCSECQSDCSINGSLSCDGNRVRECMSYKSCLIDFTIANCDINSYCYNGKCLTNSSIIPIGSYSNETMVMWNNFFGVSGDSSSNRLLIAIIGIILSGIITVIMLASFTYFSGSRFPFSIGIIITISLMCLVFFYFVSIGFIPFWILILMIILIAFALASKFISKIFGGK